MDLVLGLRSDLSHSAGHAERSARAERLCRARSRRRRFCAGIFQSARLSAATPALFGALDALLPTRIGWIAGRSHRLLRLPPGHGSGLGVMDQAMHGQFAWKLLIALALLKLLATTLSFSSGTLGGMFAPTLFIGAMLGAAVGSFEKHYFPSLTGTVGSYALAGMGVLFAGFLRAPLTSVFMVLEVSGNYSIVLPVILANTIAYLLSRSLQPVPIFEVFTQQDGLALPSMEEQREEHELHIEDALRPLNVPVVNGSESIEDASKALETANARGGGGPALGRNVVCNEQGRIDRGLRHVSRKHSDRTSTQAGSHAITVPRSATGHHAPLFPEMASAACFEPGR